MARSISAAQRARQIADDPSEREKVFRRLLGHVRAGYSLACFEEVSQETVKEYLTRYPDEWPEAELAAAMRAGQQGWEAIGRRQASGECLGNSKSWIYNMMNRYSWSDRLVVDTKTTGVVTVEVVNYSTATALASV